MTYNVKPVWIIDDDRSIRWVFEKALAREDIAFKVFASAQEALHALASSTPQVVVSDIRMPGESGLELLRKILKSLAEHLKCLLSFNLILIKMVTRLRKNFQALVQILLKV